MIQRFVHGWGFDGRFWEPLAARLTSWRQSVAERGYFGGSSEPEPDEPFVAVAHSFGAMRVLADASPQCRGLIAINGFDRFAGIPARVIDRMVTMLDRDPARVVQDFRMRIGTTDAFGTPDAALLAQDLRIMRDDDCSGITALASFPILSIQADCDPLLPQPLRERAFKTAPDLQRRNMANGGHLLPQTHPDACAQAVSAFMERLT